MLNWILQSNLTKPEILTRMKAAILASGAMYEEVEMIPFSPHAPKIARPDLRLIVYGSTSLMLTAYRDPVLRSGVFYDPERFQMANYQRQWPGQLLNGDGCCIPLGELPRWPSTPEKQWFIRPNEDGKEFSGRVDSFEELAAWSQRICALDLPDIHAQTQIWIASPKPIDKEWRLFVANDRILSASRYMHHGALAPSASDLPTEVLAFAQSLIRQYRLHDVYVMDIALSEGAYKLIECNCFNGTGFYAHDIEAVVAGMGAAMGSQS